MLKYWIKMNKPDEYRIVKNRIIREKKYQSESSDHTTYTFRMITTPAAAVLVTIRWDKESENVSNQLRKNFGN
jgi:hypothetical protein